MCSMDDFDRRPGDAYPASRDAAEPTPFEVATGILDIRPDEEQAVVEDPRWSNGWEVGVENNLDLGSMPTGAPNDTGSRLARRAWLAGFISGQLALMHGNSSAFQIPGDDSDAVPLPTFTETNIQPVDEGFEDSLKPPGSFGPWGPEGRPGV